MRRWKLPTLTFALLAAVWWTAGCSKVRDPQSPASPDKTDPGGTSGPAPVIACDQPEFDFGTVSQGENAKHIFTLVNKGKGTLRIERARGG